MRRDEGKDALFVVTPKASWIATSYGFALFFVVYLVIRRLDLDREGLQVTVLLGLPLALLIGGSRARLAITERSLVVRPYGFLYKSQRYSLTSIRGAKAVWVNGYRAVELDFEGAPIILGPWTHSLRQAKLLRTVDQFVLTLNRRVGAEVSRNVPHSSPDPRS